MKFSRFYSIFLLLGITLGSTHAHAQNLLLTWELRDWVGPGLPSIEDSFLFNRNELERRHIKKVSVVQRYSSWGRAVELLTNARNDSKYEYEYEYDRDGRLIVSKVDQDGQRYKDKYFIYRKGRLVGLRMVEKMFMNTLYCTYDVRIKYDGKNRIKNLFISFENHFGQKLNMYKVVPEYDSSNHIKSVLYSRPGHFRSKPLRRINFEYSDNCAQVLETNHIIRKEYEDEFYLDSLTYYYDSTYSDYVESYIHSMTAHKRYKQIQKGDSFLFSRYTKTANSFREGYYLQIFDDHAKLTRQISLDRYSEHENAKWVTNFTKFGYKDSLLIKHSYVNEENEYPLDSMSEKEILQFMFKMSPGKDRQPTQSDFTYKYEFYDKKSGN